MKWAYSIQHKMTASLLLTTVLVIVLFNNLSERSNSAQINRAISTIYNDRLLVESYIFQYSDNLQRVADAMDDPMLTDAQKQQLIEHQLPKLNALHESYKKTELTEHEAQSFSRFISYCTHLGELAEAGELALVKAKTKEAMDVLHALSSIQISEATLQMGKIDRLFSSAVLSSKFEVAVLIIIGIMVQALVFASRTLQAEPPKQGAHLN